MKKASGILKLLVAAAYLFACAGFGIHTCHEDGSRHFVWMLGDVSCEAIHHHSHGEDHDHHHEDGCCHTEVCVLSDAQDSDSGADRSAGAPETGIPAIVETPFFAVTVPAHNAFVASDSPPLIPSSTLSILSVWRV